MKIVICASLDFSNEIGKVAEKLTQKGHEVIIPKTSEMILDGQLTLEQIKKEKENGQITERAKKLNAIKLHFFNIKKGDVILVLNYTKKGIKNYIGPNTFLEMGFAHVLNKKIFLLNKIPDMLLKDEIKVMEPIIINGNLDKIK